MFDIENKTCFPDNEEVPERPDGPPLITPEVEAP
jgi:hypothetical protein